MTDAVRIERAGAVATVTLNRPERRNAMTLELKTALLDALRTVADDHEIRCVVLTGEGKGFCVGQDLAEHAELLQSAHASVFSTVAEHYGPIVELLSGMAKPVIAAVNGTCVGAGLGFALSCDLRIFAEDATLGTAFSGVGLTCDSGLSATLPRSVGEARARELVLLGRTFTPAEAVGWGITGEIVASSAVTETAARLAEQLAAGPTVAYAESKRLLTAGLDGTLAQALAAESTAQNRCGETEDHHNAVRSFLAREQPTFNGR
ncbi:enoyl-CoA hydratase/isomerase family protein [Microlunatus soli]|uniref:2-(1,2-epoxy-1,2-dihydrophenyl)acetyl-CoA isomerase n=1 Tax=Microlunatus soli TaxID=630515 RepID=A0A1H1V0T5_9ACTN|nr:enoyl-CoA hydratase-related protein [Microlunatus soli]SDS77976.1 2-(1,2-epoxy-1,2-dihydrophenyl)acetyl-CoA isomerase [Microlunatus soli]